MSGRRRKAARSDRLETPVGKSSVFNLPGEFGRLMYKDEYDLRDGLAALAWLHGWTVATEVPVSTGARVDVMLTSPAGQVLVFEIKVDLTARHQIRKGFQQLEGYRLELNADEAFLIAPKIDHTIAETLTAIYRHICCMDFTWAMETVRSEYMLNSYQPDKRAIVAFRRHKQIRDLVRLADKERETRLRRLRQFHLNQLAKNYPAASRMLNEAIDDEMPLVLL